MNINKRIKTEKGHNLTADKVEWFYGNFKNANSKRIETTFKDVSYVPNIDYNQFSLTRIMNKNISYCSTIKNYLGRKN